MAFVFCLLISANFIHINSSYALTQQKSDPNEYINDIYLANVLPLERLDFVGDEQSHTQSPNASRPFTLREIQLLLAAENGRYARAIQITHLPYIFDTSANTNMYKVAHSIISLFFPVSDYGDQIKIEYQVRKKEINMNKFRLEFLNLTGNKLTEQFLDRSNTKHNILIHSSSLFFTILIRYFANLRVLQLSQNNIRHLERKHFDLFTGQVDQRQEAALSKLEVILLNSNQLVSIRHDTFYDLNALKYVDLSGNKLKLIHPLTFSFANSLEFLNLANNLLRALYNTPSHDDSNRTSSLPNLKAIYLTGNTQISCDCGLLWLYHLRDRIEFDNFTCQARNKSTNSTELLNFSHHIHAEFFSNNSCKMPKVVVNTKRLEESSQICLFRSLSKSWFQWTVWTDILPTTTPYPYMMSKDDDTSDSPSHKKHIFHTWRLNDVVFDCSNRESESQSDESQSTIIWKTQYGYLSYLDDDLMESLGNDNYATTSTASESNNQTDEIAESTTTNSNYNSFKIFYKMNKLTKIYKNLTIKVGSKIGAQTSSVFYVNNKSQLIVTNMRQVVSGPFVCISLNENGIDMYEYDMHVRTGVGEYFIYSLFISVISMVIPSILGIIICCYCEYQADKNYPMTPPCYPTPMGTTPPNFDFNEWMASYLPNINIQETLDQVSKKLRKGMEKATVTVKSLGITSTAYIYSMYEQSSQRWSDIKNYVPTLNVPTLTLPSLNLPTMKYPPVGQIANRMRTGMGNVFVQLREFCGTSDLNHTASIVDIESDTNASNAVGKTYILDQLNMRQQNQNQSNYLRFLYFIKEESKHNKQQKKFIGEIDTPTSDLTTITGNETQPSTSANSQGYTNQLPKIAVRFYPINNASDDDMDDDYEDDYDDDSYQKKHGSPKQQGNTSVDTSNNNLSTSNIQPGQVAKENVQDQSI